MFEVINTPAIPKANKISDLIHADRENHNYIRRGTLNVDKVLVAWLNEPGFGETYQYFFYTVCRDYVLQNPDQILIQDIDDQFIPLTAYSKLVAELITKLSTTIEDHNAVIKGRGIVAYVCRALGNLQPEVNINPGFDSRPGFISPQFGNRQMHGRRFRNPPHQAFSPVACNIDPVWLAGITSGLVDKHRILNELFRPECSDIVTNLGTQIKCDYNLPELTDPFSLGLLVIAEHNKELTEYFHLLGDYYTTAVWEAETRIVDIVAYVK